MRGGGTTDIAFMDPDLHPNGCLGKLCGWPIWAEGTRRLERLDLPEGRHE
jgi:hypothetical protein